MFQNLIATKDSIIIVDDQAKAVVRTLEAIQNASSKDFSIPWEIRKHSITCI